MSVSSMNVGEIIAELTVDSDKIDELTGEIKQKFSIITTHDIRKDLHEYYRGGIKKGQGLGFHNTNEGFLIRTHELTIVSGTNGSGKTMWLSQVILNQLQSDKKCIVASLEMHPIFTCSRMLAQLEGSSDVTEDCINKFVENMKNKLYIYNQANVTTTKTIFAMIEYAYNVLGCEIIVVDSLMKMNDIAEDNYDAQKRFVDQLTAMCRRYPIHIFLVAHTRKLRDVYEHPSKNDVHGSNHIVNLADNLLCVWRNKMKEKQMEDNKLSDDQIRNIPDAKVFVQKQRNYIGENGEPTFNFYYDRKGMRYRDRP
jgi:twinkle protein